MASFEELSFSTENFSGEVRLFPLPNLVMFPHVMQPLHIFEPRYRDLLEETLHNDHLIGMAVLAPGWESSYDGRPALYPTICIGKVTTYYKLEDGTYNLLLLGVHRASLVEELAPRHRFREATIQLCEDICTPDQASVQAELQRKLRKTFRRLLPVLPEAQEQIDQLLCSDISLGVLTDLFGFLLDIEIGKKESLLAELNVCRRAEMLLQYLDAVAKDDQPGRAGSIPYPPQFSSN